MTAEIAILNKSAVTLAADSAVTISIGGTEKIYNTADKLFELSPTEPVGIMIFNNMSFLQIPIEVIIKDYRASSKCTPQKTIDAHAGEFLKYLEKSVPKNKGTLESHIRDLVNRVFESILREFERKSLVIVLKGGKNVETELRKQFNDLIDQKISEFSSEEKAECFADLELDDIHDAHSESCEAIIEDQFNNFPLQKEDKHKLQTLFSWILASNKTSDLATGIVISGFGTEEIFPSLNAYIIDGIIAGRLKIIQTENVDIDRNGPPGDIIPFAQREMVDRFLYGIDSEFEEAIEDYMSGLLDTFSDNIIENAIKKPKWKKDTMKNNARKMREASIKHFNDNVTSKIRNIFKSQILYMVLGMPKQELAHLAESLVNLTSTKRRVSAEQETVGGPIDVAVISRGEGFVWVRRKHYFDPQLNPRYFYRTFGRP